MTDSDYEFKQDGNILLLLVRAIQVASQAHGDTMSQDGTPYILHPLRLMMKCEDFDYPAKIVAVLHDVVEDTDVTLGDLKEWLPDYMVNSLDRLTRREGEEYEAYITRISGDRIAIKVKLLDLYDNIDLTRLSKVGDYELQRAAKYHRAIKVLKASRQQQDYQ